MGAKAKYSFAQRNSQKTETIMMRLLFLFIATLFIYTAQAQDSLHKQLSAVRLAGGIKIDGDLNDAAWATAPMAGDFAEWRPKFGQKEDFANRTEVKFLYDNTAIYVGGYCHEKSRDSITKELVGRDVVGANDFVGIIFDTYNDKINGFGFYTTVLGEQFDAKYSDANGEDGSWSAVWFCETKQQPDGWTFEMRIPYSALRFAKNTHTWGLNVTRRRVKSGRQLMWNPVNPNVPGFLNQSGIWKGFDNIQPPLRLSFSPYFSSYVNHYPYRREGKTEEKDFTASVNGGMDVKYGINQNYTLDMTLIPDFGQVQSDRLVLNLTPFEVQYQENRPFFNEGTELFSKGNLFYSRRIGSTPLRAYDPQLNDHEIMQKTPSQSKLINATKISGRNRHGLGLGFFNAITAPMYATVVDTTTGIQRKANVGTLNNYNIFVADQTLKNNSSVSFVNTSLIRSGDDYDANVSAAVFNLNNKQNTYSFSGKVAFSNLFYKDNTVSGYSHMLTAGKGGGRFNFFVTQELADKRYNINDMGILMANNFLDHYIYFGYKWNTPKKWYNSIFLNFNQNISQRFTDARLQDYNTNINVNGQLKNLYRGGVRVFYKASGNDFYEPRVSGAVYKTPWLIGTGAWMMSNEAKKLLVDVNFSKSFTTLKTTDGEIKGTRYFIGSGQRYRFNDKLSVNANVTYERSNNNTGFERRGVFARRLRQTVENTIGVKYNLSREIGLTLNARHYWSSVENKEFYQLRTDGRLMSRGSANAYNYSVNFFNIDMVTFWQFAPGSFLNLVWKDAILEQNFNESEKYFYNLNKTLSANQNNNFSIKLIYFIDYFDLKRRFGKKAK